MLNSCRYTIVFYTQQYCSQICCVNYDTTNIIFNLYYYYYYYCFCTIYYYVLMCICLFVCLCMSKNKCSSGCLQICIIWVKIYNIYTHIYIYVCIENNIKVNEWKGERKILLNKIKWNNLKCIIYRCCLYDYRMPRGHNNKLQPQQQANKRNKIKWNKIRNKMRVGEIFY